MFSQKQLTGRDPNLEDPSVLSIDRLPPRATSVPALHENVFFKNKESSELLVSLNGVCRFAYRKDDDLDGFEAPGYPDDDWDELSIPSMWQYARTPSHPDGYGKPRYPNVRYCFPFDPPYIRRENPVGYYRRRFTLDRVTDHTILYFGGVDNAYYVWLNGEFVGFSKGSRNAAEFDVSDKVREGENLLAVKVFTFSDASYLEDQDMLLANGIFRDVYLLTLGGTYLWDYHVATSPDSVTVKTSLGGETVGARVELTLDGQTGTVTGAKGEFTFRPKNPKLWNAEEPNLYTLTMRVYDGETLCEVHTKRVGILWSYVKGNRFYVNDRPVYIKGVNRHENDGKKGKALSVADIERDLKTIKANRLNAVRLSHYPNDPATYEIAAELGLYFMDESDIETHGCGDATGDQGYLSKDPAWLAAYLDRTRRIFEANKNEVCIFMRSTGNECGTGENLCKCADLLASLDPSRTVIMVQEPIVKNGSAMYTNFRKIGYYPMSKYDELGPDGAPVLAIEYAHAMGNSPGTLQDYWDHNYTHDEIAGGFVWEFRSHGFYAEDEKGRPFVKYGGDFDDVYHWSNFTLDGYLMTDSTPKPSWKELGTMMFPAYVRYESGGVRMENGRLILKNTHDFTPLDGIFAGYELKRDGRVIASGSYQMPSLSPHEEAELPVPALPETPVPGAVYDLDVIFTEAGQEVCRRQFRLPDHAPAMAAERVPFTHSVKLDGRILTVSGEDLSISFDRGMLCSYRKNGAERLDGKMRLNLFRAPTDNDGIVGLFPRHIAEWDKAFLDKMDFDLFDLAVDERDECVTVAVGGKYCADSLSEGFEVKLVYEILAGGVIFVKLDGMPYGALPDVLPRIGVVLPVKKAFGKVSWAGRGGAENYPDELAAAPVGRYERTLETINTFYDVPQENGNHEGTRFVRLLDGENALTAAAKDAFSFSYHDFTLDDLASARHRNELEKSGTNFLYLDYKMRGLGSHSCGPEPEPAYELHPHAFRFCFTLSAADEAEAETLARSDFGASTAALSGKYHYDPVTKKAELLACDVE